MQTSVMASTLSKIPQRTKCKMDFQTPVPDDDFVCYCDFFRGSFMDEYNRRLIARAEEIARETDSCMCRVLDAHVVMILMRMGEIEEELREANEASQATEDSQQTATSSAEHHQSSVYYADDEDEPTPARYLSESTDRPESSSKEEDPSSQEVEDLQYTNFVQANEEDDNTEVDDVENGNMEDDDTEVGDVGDGNMEDDDTEHGDMENGDDSGMEDVQYSEHESDDDPGAPIQSIEQNGSLSSSPASSLQ
ncbi:hypothetical protein BDY21DRAFT_365884 [Lineolata rhizophorae]|uniref:Uncharacterized protein n=1 Tax=Lineolata rhizophorae TaxID=578093 RepID=A0A6A6NTU3_9PEZI|nr:hypothetical protein BDY21DRAFT_365884 [Lineolata rhizophorae]